MKYGVFRRVGGLLAIVGGLLFSLLLVSCADAGMSCDFDSDCAHDGLCVESFCADPCASDQQCASDQTCQLFIREHEADQVLVCMIPFESDNDNNNAAGVMQCSDDEACREMLGSSDAVCGLNYRCVSPEFGASPEAAPEYDSVLIRDLTSRVKVDDAGHPGTVLSAVFVRDEVGSIVGYGETLEFVSGTGGGEQRVGHLDGQSVQLDESGQCVVGAEASMSALDGEGGYYLVSFVDSQGNQLGLELGWKITVIAWSAQCGGYGDLGHEPGEYDVSLCVSIAGSIENIGSDCQKVKEKVSGYTEFLVTLGG